MNLENHPLKSVADELMGYCQKRVGFNRPPDLFFREDEENAKSTLGKTAYYDPANLQITVYTTGRHDKDILRSIAHELVHHIQNLRGDFDNNDSTEPGYAQNDPHLRNMEKEAYLLGNILFRDWEDGKKTNLKETQQMNDARLIIEHHIRQYVIQKIKEGDEKILEKLGYRPTGQAARIGHATGDILSRIASEPAGYVAKLFARALGAEKGGAADETIEKIKNAIGHAVGAAPAAVGAALDVAKHGVMSRKADFANPLANNENPESRKKYKDFEATQLKEEENIQMNKDQLKEMIRGYLTDILSEKKSKPDDDLDGVPDWADKKPGEDDHAKSDDKPKKKAKKGEIPPQFKKGEDKEQVDEAEALDIDEKRETPWEQTMGQMSGLFAGAPLGAIGAIPKAVKSLGRSIGKEPAADKKAHLAGMQDKLKRLAATSEPTKLQQVQKDKTEQTIDRLKGEMGVSESEVIDEKFLQSMGAAARGAKNIAQDVLDVGVGAVKGVGAAANDIVKGAKRGYHVGRYIGSDKGTAKYTNHSGKLEEEEIEEGSCGSYSRDDEIDEELDQIQTPEQENALYEARFTNRDQKLFNKLMSKWAK